MESYGALLRKAREEKGIDFETIARETSITQEYLEALEEEDVCHFSGIKDRAAGGVLML